MLSLPVSSTRVSVRRRRRAQTDVVVRALQSLCDVCGGSVGGAAVIFGPVSYCSIDCAAEARHRFVAGNYLG